MILLPNLCALAFLGADAGASPATAPNSTPAITVEVPQGPPMQFNPKGSAAPSGGTPEPGSMLLLVGSALGYGAWRLKRSRNTKES